MEETKYPLVPLEGFCARFERCLTSLIEEPETCEVCVYYAERDESCRWPEQTQ